jgi:hypothetical protein
VFDLISTICWPFFCSWLGRGLNLGVFYGFLLELRVAVYDSYGFSKWEWMG